MPEPFGPMIAATSPAFTVRLRPSRIGWPWMETERFLTSSIIALSDVSGVFKKGGDGFAQSVKRSCLDFTKSAGTLGASPEPEG